MLPASFFLKRNLSLSQKKYDHIQTKSILFSIIKPFYYIFLSYTLTFLNLLVMKILKNVLIIFTFFIKLAQQKKLSKHSNRVIFYALLPSVTLSIIMNTYAQVKVYNITEKQSRCSYEIKRGDTLFGLARKYKIPLKKLVSTNHFIPPYKLLVGQKIHLPKSTRLSCATLLHNRERRGSQKSTVSVKYKNNSEDEKRRLLSRRTIHWTWPVKKYVRISNEKLKNTLSQQALVLQVKPNTKVGAAASGVVIYAGEDVSGYGKLIIIENNISYLSIYGNNSKVFVRKGNVVKAGQEIAEMGSEGMRRTKLHFEIRHNEKPVNPLHYLPKR